MAQALSQGLDSALRHNPPLSSVERIYSNYAVTSTGGRGAATPSVPMKEQ